MHGIDNYKYHKYRFVHMYSRDIHLYYELLLGLAKLHEHNHLYVYIYYRWLILSCVSATKYRKNASEHCPILNLLLVYRTDNNFNHILEKMHAYSYETIRANGKSARPGYIYTRQSYIIGTLYNLLPFDRPKARRRKWDELSFWSVVHTSALEKCSKTLSQSVY